MLSQPWDLLGFRFLSSSLIFNDEILSSVLRQKVGRLLEFCNGVHLDAKNVLKTDAKILRVEKNLRLFPH